MASTGFVEVTDYKARVGKIKAGSDDDIKRDILAVSLAINKRLDRQFERETGVTSRVLYPRLAGRELSIPDLSSLTPAGVVITTADVTIKVDTDNDGSFADETAFGVNDFELHPLNAPYGDRPEPYTSIYIPTWSTRGTFVPSLRVQITALWGWPSVPEDVAAAVVDLTRLRRNEMPENVQGLMTEEAIFESLRYYEKVTF